MKTAEIRRVFLEYFVSAGHQRLASASLIPLEDPSLLFVNAGMVPFKNIFLGLESPPAPCVTSAQCCVRAGGKHNDLENVGYTARHHTFFEMLGNFSFGQYFKREAIKLSWRFLTEILQLPAEKLWVTVYHDDKESADIWLTELKIDPARFSWCGEEDNFWSMGSVGPCGPCTEIFYDHGPDVPGGPPGSEAADGDRYVEIWNLVFMQYNREQSGELKSLPRPCVDTGMGLERIAAVLQGVHDNYDIDIFQHLLFAARQLIPGADRKSHSLRVIADHIRAVCFIMLAGVSPSNIGRGYLLRRILRRAMRHGYQQGQTQPFFHKLVPALGEVMGETYPELIQKQSELMTGILQEEQQFLQTLEKGVALFEAGIATLSEKVVPGTLIFELYDTYGFPPDLTADMAREKQLDCDEAGFVEEMKKQKARSRQNSCFSIGDHALQSALAEEKMSIFTGYSELTSDTCIQRILSEAKEPVHILQAGAYGYILLEATPFYAESGGQVGDTGFIISATGTFEVLSTFYVNHVPCHYGQVKQGAVAEQETVLAKVSAAFRKQVACHHSATHLLHTALRTVLGDTVQQKGSLVAQDKLRFDFSYSSALTEKQKKEVEEVVNAAILANAPVETVEMPLSVAQKKGVLALFGEKYTEIVRVVRMGVFSYEVCGGTHVQTTGELGAFFIRSETAVGTGIRRIEAVAGPAAIQWARYAVNFALDCAKKIQHPVETIDTGFSELLKKQEVLLSQKVALEQKYCTLQAQSLLAQVVLKNGKSVLVACLSDVSRQVLQQVLDIVVQAINETYIVLLAGIEGNAVHIFSAVAPDCITQVSAVSLLRAFAQIVSGKGGGKPNFAQGGGRDVSKVTLGLDVAQDWITERIAEN